MEVYQCHNYFLAFLFEQLYFNFFVSGFNFILHFLFLQSYSKFSILILILIISLHSIFLILNENSKLIIVAGTKVIICS